MAEPPAAIVGPTALGLPDLTNPEILTSAQWNVLMAVMDTVICSCRQSESEHPDPNTARLDKAQYDETISHLRRTTTLDLGDTTTIDAFLAEKPSEMPLFQDILRRILGSIPDDKVASIRMVMSLLDNRAASLPLTGHLKQFSQLSIEDRTRVLHSWRSSSLASLRVLYKQLGIIAKHVYVRASSLFNALSGFSPVPAGWHPVESFPFEFMQFDPSATPIDLETDVVVVGSGCGAGVVARNIAIAGHRVIVVDKSYHVPTTSFPLNHSEAFFHLFEQGGHVASEDGSITVTAGSCFGGGGSVNWSACLQTQNTVRDEWADERGLKFFKSSEFQTRLDNVSEHMGVSDEFIRHNHGNAALLEGARKLGFSAKPVPQNSGRCEHYDGHCALGCWRGEKQGPVNGWFPAAAKRGAKFLEGFKVDKVLLSKQKGKQVARGVTGTWTPRSAQGAAARTVTIRAKRVVVSAGSLCSPIILTNSGVKNKHIGRNLHLHPTTFVGGVFKEETRPWEGGILTSVVTSFDNLDGKGHGVKLERASMMPSMSLPWLDWTSGFDYKVLLSKYSHIEVFIAITRDRESGHVISDPIRGTPRVVYTPSKFDTRHNLAGMIALAKILYVQGALEIHPALPGLRPFIRGQESPSNGQTAQEFQDTESGEGITNEKFQSWLREMESHGNKTPDTPFCSAHQMSSCRMSATGADGVVDEYGKVWGCEGLYVADASVLPSASGVNPMVTIMAICDRISTAMAEDLARERQEVARM
ncbi:hypothetical protein ACJ41O_014502 [Fusarium nematophilum]